MTKLKRTISWKVFALYGLGNILGAGIYVLVGEVAAESGNALIWSFLAAGIVALFTALTYSALATKYPVSAGAAVYTERAFMNKYLSTLIGLSLAFTGIVSAGVLLRGFDRYFQQLLQTFDLSLSVPSWIVILSTLLILTIIALKGIKESAFMVVSLTLLEAGGLIAIVVYAVLNGDIASATIDSVRSLSSVEPIAILLGGFLAFYAFIGFEDMVNIAEEVKTPSTSIKKGMIWALVLASILYMATAIASLSVLSSAELASSKAPLASVFQQASGISFPVITLIGLFAVINGVLAQIIMSSRVLYGLAREGWLTKKLANVSKVQRTPTLATLLSSFVIAVGALILPLATLAKITSFALLIIFSVVQVCALRLIKLKKINLNKIIPILGLITNLIIIAVQISTFI